MVYSVKWVKEHLGITENMVRRYEEKGLMNKEYYQNPITNRREYSLKDIEKLWEIRIYQNIGFTLNQIKDIFNNPSLDFEAFIASKLNKLEESYEKTREYIGFIKAVKLLGQFPSRPDDIESISFQQFKEQCLKKWNIHENHNMNNIYDIIHKILDNSIDHINHEDLLTIVKMLSAFGNMNAVMIHGYTSELVKRKHLNVNHPEVQLIVGMLYDKYNEVFNEYHIQMNKQQFVKYVSPVFVIGDIHLLQEKNYGKDGCEFIFKALTYFGQYNNEV